MPIARWKASSDALAAARRANARSAAGSARASIVPNVRRLAATTAACAEGGSRLPRCASSSAP